MTDRIPTILQIIPRLETGGAEMSTIEIAGALTRVGARALVASDGGRMAETLAEAGGLLIGFPAATKNPARLVSNGAALARICREQDVSLIHARSRAPAWSALLAAKQAKLPFVTTYHGAYGEKNAAKNLYNSVMARGDRVIANSRFTAALIRQRHGAGEPRVRVIHRGVDLAAHDPTTIAPARVARLRATWGIGRDTPVILHAARLTSWKGQRVVIDAAAQLLSDGRLGEAVVILAGDAQGRDPYARELEQRIVDAGLSGRVRIVGHCADIPAAFATAQVAVVASVEPEAFGRASAEAQSTGCPVIATDLGALPETLVASENGRTGWLVPPGDASALAAALAHALSLDPGNRSEMGARARAHIEATYSVERMQHATLRVYDELLGTDLAGRFTAA